MDRGQKNTRKLSKAIQTCIADLVDTMPFTDSEIPDVLIQEGCITEDECKEIREKTNRKDQIRNLILLVKGRSYGTMEKYLNAMNKHCPTTVEKIWNQYANLMNENTGPWKCPMCELKDCVNVKYVIDNLYGNEIISTGLYSMICNSQNPFGQQDYLWDSVLKACKEANIKYLTDALKAKGHYNHIAESLDIYHGAISNEASCLCSKVGAPRVLSKPESDETGSSATYSPISTPFTSTVEDENTTPKTLHQKNDRSSENSIANTQSEMQSFVSESTLKANTGHEDDEDITIYDEHDDESDIKTSASNTLFGCLLCCRKKREKLHSYDEQLVNK